MNSTKIRCGVYPFYDDVHFPKGFSRSGEFSILESKILTDFGQTLKSLHYGVLMPDNDEEKRLIAVANGEQPAVSQIEKTWIKYLRAIAPKAWHTLNGKSKTPVATDSSEYELEL